MNRERSKNMKKTELKPCPFCGNKDLEFTDMHELEACGNADTDMCPVTSSEPDKYCPQKSVICGILKGGCGAHSGFYSTEEEAAEAWNRRVGQEGGAQ